MKKTVLFLMNGFGIEQINSYNIYSDKLMPNLDSYTKKYLFSSIESTAYDLVSGYREFSTGSKEPLTYLLIDNYVEKFGENKNFQIYIDSIKSEGKIHLFFSVESERCIEHLKSFLKYIKSKKNNLIYLHLVLTSPNVENYKEIEKIINKIIYDIKNCKIGIIVGINTLNSLNLTSFFNMFENEVGEKWKEITKKINALVTTKIKPLDVKEFFMNEGFKFNNGDSIFFFNYEYCDLNNFMQYFNKLNFSVYSLFSINGIKYSMFSYPKSGISMLNNLNKIDSKALILSNKENIKIINYYCCGLENVISDKIFFSRTDNGLSPNFIKSVIRDSLYDLIIINYPIDSSSSLNELKDKLSKLDMFLGLVHDVCIEEKISLFISSLYGMQKDISIDNYTTATVNFYGKVPFIVVDPIFNKTNFSISIGNIYNLANTVYTNINNKFDGQVLIRKKSSIEKLLKK